MRDLSPSDFYALLSTLFRQVADPLAATSAVALERWPAGSAQRQLLAELQAAQATLAAHRQQRQAQVEASAREQATLLAISQTLASALVLRPGLILDQLRETLDYTYAALWELRDSYLVALAVRAPPRLEQSLTLRMGLTDPHVLELLLNERQPIRIANVGSAGPPAQLLRILLEQQADAPLLGLPSWMWVPLAVDGRVIGGMTIAHAESNAFTAHHADLALTVANHAAITMVNAHRYEQAQTLATHEEQQRLARNLHDAVNQSLFAAGLIAETLPLLWELNPEEGRQSMVDLRCLIRGAQAELRGLLGELRPSVLLEAEPTILLNQLADAFTGRTNVPVRVTVAGDGLLPADVQITLYRLCQEALSNVVKHAAASKVVIDLRYTAHLVNLRIRDDGRGFNVNQPASGRHGLSMMRERAQSLGAVLTIASQPGQGTEVAMRWRQTPAQESV